MDVKVIKNSEEYSVASARFLDLMTRAPNISAEEDNELERLAFVIENYEKALVPTCKPDPIDATLFRMDQMKQ